MNRSFRLTLVAALIAVAGNASAQQAQVRQYRTSNEKPILSEFLAVLAIPNVASDSAGIANNVAFITSMNAERTKMDLPISKSVLAAIQGAFPGRTLAIPTLGGSLPLSTVSDALHVPTITVPIANYDNNQHAEDESIRIQNRWDGIEMMAALMMMK